MASAIVSPQVTMQGHLAPRAYKRPFDLTLLVLSHIVLFPFLLIAWIVIPIAILIDDGGPVFYVQTRAGLHGRPFKIIKFRTMKHRDTQGPLFTTDGDERVTRLGRFLRRTALDEIPQLINIWKGDMSLVGPRAIPKETHDEYLRECPAFAQRYYVLPGLTGFAAVNLPRHCGPDLRLEEDLRYIQSAGVWTDLKVIFVSVWVTITGRWGRGDRSIGKTA